MGVSLTKGGNVSLTKEAPNLTAVAVGLGWDVRTTTGTDFDLDASAIATGADKKVVSDQHFVFFNNLKSPDGSIEHAGDNRTGEGEGDDEVINVDLAAVPRQHREHLLPPSRSTTPKPEASRSARSATPTSASSTAPTAPSWPATTCPRTPPPKPPWCSVSSTGTAPSGSSALSARATRPASRASPATTASTSSSPTA